jgi:hypothetical protein
LAQYERDVQETLAALRSQQEILRVDGAQDGASATAPRLLALVESVPELGADKAFARLRQGVVDVEDRIALAR